MKRKSKLGLKGHFKVKGCTVFFDSTIFQKDTLYFIAKRALKKGCNLKAYFLHEIENNIMDVRYSVGRPVKEGK